MTDPGRLQLDLEELAQRLWTETLALAERYNDAAIKEAAYRSTYAQALLRAKAEDPKVTVAEAEAIATERTDEEYRERRIAEAMVRAHEELVRSLRAELDAVRTIRADQRRAT